MEEKNIIDLWKGQNVKIEQSLTLNKKLLNEVINLKVRNSLQSFARFKTRGIIIAVIYLLLLGMVLSYSIINYSSAANYFIVSIGAIFLINLKALADYIKHLVMINDIDYDGSVTEIQEKLAKIKLSIFKHNRIIVLQLPFWTTFFLSNKWFPQDAPTGLLIFQVAITVSFIYLAYWLYRNLRPENVDKKLFRILINGSGGKSLMKAIKLYNEIAEYQNEDKTTIKNMS